jgi:hypothetical protein
MHIMYMHTSSSLRERKISEREGARRERRAGGRGEEGGGWGCSRFTDQMPSLKQASISNRQETHSMNHRCGCQKKRSTAQKKKNLQRKNNIYSAKDKSHRPDAQFEIDFKANRTCF